MKKYPVLLLLLLAAHAGFCQNKNLPAPTSNLQTLPAGSFVIAMDNVLQTNTAGVFNLKTYGLITYLLNNKKKVKWVIKAGKLKDGIDFSGTAEQRLPDFAAAATRDFRAGPFVIFAADTAGVAALVNAYYTSNGLTGNNRPRVYRLTAAVTNVDIRFDMSGFRPKALVLDDGKNEVIHTTFMSVCGIPSANYTTGPATNLLIRCYTFASEPHNSTTTPAIITSIRKFVQFGGNFLAQCDAVLAYENHASGRFQTNAGITVTNTSVALAATIYPNPDLPFSQFQGVFNMNLTGAVKNWRINTGGSFVNNAHNHATGGTLISQTPIGASVSKLTAAGMAGGLVFYLGNHDFTNLSSLPEINGIRMYMNAFLTPVAINQNCNTNDSLPFPLAIKLSSFTAVYQPVSNRVQLNWVTANETNVSHFVVERSTDGEHFTDAGMVISKGTNGDEQQYTFPDPVATTHASILYYRLRTVSKDGGSEWSDTRLVGLPKEADDKPALTAFPNPFTGTVTVQLPRAWTGSPAQLSLLTVTGNTVEQWAMQSATPSFKLEIKNLPPGMYLLRGSCNGIVSSCRLIRQ